MKKAKKILSVGIILTLIMSMAVMLSGCGGPKNLEEYINSNEEAQQSIESLSTASEDGSGLTVDVKENTLIYTYKYSQTFEQDIIDQMAPAIEKALNGQAATFENVSSTLEEESGISGIIVKVLYVDGDGNEIYSKEYK